MRLGIIDIGSSSIKLIIGEEKGNNINILESLKNVIPIGKSTFLRERISQEIINQTVTILEKYKRVLQEYAVTNVRVIATTAVREARNKNIFIDTVLRKTGYNIEVLTVGDVVYYIDSYLSHKLKNKYPIHEKNLLIAELGAGSLDISVMEKGYTLLNIGLPIGTFRLKQLIGKLDGSLEETYEGAKEHIEIEFLHLKKAIPKIEIDDVILIDETYPSYHQNLLPGRKEDSEFFRFQIGECEEMLSKLSGKNGEEVSREFKLPLEISDTIITYAYVLNAFFGLTQNKQIYILETSLSEAVLANMLLKFELSEKYNKPHQLISVAKFLCRKYNVDFSHAQYVADLSQVLFEKLKGHLGLRDDDLLYLLLAAYLHDIGMFIHNRSHHKHTEYIISSLNLFRLTEEEIKIIACVGRYHRRSSPAQTHVLYNSLPGDKQILVQKLSAILKISNALDHSHKQKIKKIEVKFNRNDDVVLSVTASGNFILEKEDFSAKKELFEEITGNKISLSVKT